MNSKIRSSSTSASSHGLKGPRPTPLSVAGPTKIAKKQQPGVAPARPPVVVYLRSPKIIHVAPENFRGLVQRLTGVRATTEPNALRCCGHNDDENVLIDQFLNTCTARNVGGYGAAGEGLDFGAPTMRAVSAHSFDVRMC